MHNHKKYIKDRNKLKESNLCSNCAKNPISVNRSKYWCDNCLDKAKKYVLTRQKNFKKMNLCRYCGSQPCNKNSENTRKKKSIKELLCEKCYLKKRAEQNFGSKKKWILLKKLFDKQKGICAYTGIKLEIGKNASIDHKKPCGSKNRIVKNSDNLQWTCYIVNYMKASLSETEFLELIKKIYLYKFSGRLS